MDVLLTASGLFAILFLVGFLRPKANGWKLVDIIYYPAGAIGVILLFFAANSERRVFNLERAFESQRLTLEKVQLQKPKIIKGSISLDLIGANAGLIKAVSDLGIICMQTFSIEPRCSVTKELSGPLKNAHDKIQFLFSENKGVENVIYGYCSTFSGLLEELSERNALRSSVINSMAEWHKRALGMNFHFLDYHSSKKYLDDFVVHLQQQSDLIFRAITGSEYELVQSIYGVQNEYAKTILGAYDICWHAPKVIRDGTFSSWTKKIADVNASLKNTMSKVMAARKKSTREQSIHEFLIVFWPYAIIFALALKFGKSIATLRQ